MLDHISLGVTDLERSRRFYDAVLRPLGLVRIVDFQGRGSDYGAMAGQLGVEFTITAESDVTPLLGMHVCFRAPDRASVRAFHGAALIAGGHDDGGPGVRSEYHRTTMQPLSAIPTGTASRRSATRRRRP